MLSYCLHSLTRKNCLCGLALLLIALFLAARPAAAAAPHLGNVLYGASYYNEYLPVERLEQDVALMEKAGLSFVRMGDSIWPGIEPREGEFEFAWFDRIVDRLDKAGIKIILMTPTYSIPPWLYKKHPEILAIRMDGKRNAYGMRQNMDITNPAYLFYCDRLVRQLVAHYKDHPAVVGYQLDNETSAYGTAGPNVQVGFVNELKKKFKTTQELNRVWGLAYWGQLLNDWDEFPSREGTINPGYKLEWERYQQKLCTDFLAWQAAIVRQVKRPDQFVTHDFAWPALPNVNAYEAAKALDIVSANCYYDVQDDFTGEPNAYVGDYFRSVGRANYLLTETNAQTIGWDSKGQFPPYDGQLRLGVYSHLSSGANLVAYWHWHSIHYGQEMFWKGILGHDFEPGRVYDQVNVIAHELKQVGPRLVNLKKVNKVAILYSADSNNAIQFMPFSDKIDYQTILRQFHRTLYNLNVGVDFLFPENPDFSNYDVVVVPPLYIASDALLEKLSEFVQRGGHLVLSFKSGFCNEYSTIRWVRMPGSLSKACGFTYQEFSNLKQELPLKGDPFQAGDKNRVSSWAEYLIPDTAESLAFYDHPVFGKFPAITRNRYGKGTLTYEGTVLSDELQKKVLLDVLKQAHLAGPDQDTPASVRVKHGMGNSGKMIHYYLNYSAQTQTVNYPYADAVDVLTRKAVAKSQAVNLGAWDLVILEEQ
ncbi:MAG: beta-galactosidase [Terriglobia bacterium]